jgi:hypothetical protein
LVHGVKDHDTVTLKLLRTGDTTAEGEDGHARGKAGVNPGDTVFDHRAAIWCYA